MSIHALELFVLIVALDVLALLADLALELCGATTVTDFARSHRWLQIPLVGVQFVAGVALLVHFSS